MQTDEHKSIDMKQIDEQKSSLRDILNVLFRHKRKSVIFFVVVVVTVTVGTFLKAVDTYESEAKLLVKIGRENITTDPLIAGGSLRLPQNRESAMNAELAILSSRHVAEQVVDKIGAESFFYFPSEERFEIQSLEEAQDAKIEKLHDKQAGTDNILNPDTLTQLAVREEAINLVVDSLYVEPDEESNIISLRFQTLSPEFSRDTLEIIINTYLDYHIKVHQAQATPKFYQKHMEILFAELTQKERLVEQFCKTNSIVSMDEQKKILLGEISSLQNSIDDANSSIKSSQSAIAWLEKNLQEDSPITEFSSSTGAESRVIENLKNRLIEFKFVEADLVAKYPDDSRVLKDIREKIRFAEAELAKEQQRVQVTDPAYQQMGTEHINVQGQIARKDFLDKEIKRRKEELATLTSHELELKKLKDDVIIASNEYQRYQDNLQQANISATFDTNRISNISIVQPATLPIDPVESNKKRNIALSIFLGLFGGIGLAFFWEYFDDSLKTYEDVRKRLRLPVLATISCKEGMGTLP